MKAYYSDVFELPLPAGHRFPVDKYRLLRQRVATFADRCGIDLIVAPAADRSELELTHTETYLESLFQGTLTTLEQRRIGFPWSPGMVRRCRRSTGGTLAAARSALADGIGVHLAGGTHHAFADAGQGFCVFNDVAVAAQVLLAERQIQRAAVIDCDVHQGNGTAAIFGGDERVFTFSMHGDRNYPFRKCAGDLDVALADGTGDATYLEILQEIIRDRLPLDEVDCVFYLAGADPYAGDRFGRLSLSKDGLAARDQIVLETCAQRHLPLVIVMAGGYAPNLNDVVDIHARTIATAALRQV
jgi:acetoin utilization deacetylase AcuC-like enzyme